MSDDLHLEIAATASQSDFSHWLSMVRATGGCAEPIHLWGESLTPIVHENAEDGL